ncbi:MAG: hypothetical protein DDT37_01470 [Firmicutes bacterium]|nr:hypothetical protein [candidate division NPL-UPA2 bacterium]MBT9156484.1 hypothetical protein [candidate division NPL-UPA2 bacterium]
MSWGAGKTKIHVPSVLPVFCLTDALHLVIMGINTMFAVFEEVGL